VIREQREIEGSQINQLCVVAEYGAERRNRREFPFDHSFGDKGRAGGAGRVRFDRPWTGPANRGGWRRETEGSRGRGQGQERGGDGDEGDGRQ